MVAVDDLNPVGPGELNYLFTKIALRYLLNNGLNYRNMNDIAGAMGCSLKEIYARVARPYEDRKIIQNGDLPEFKILHKLTHKRGR